MWSLLGVSRLYAMICSFVLIFIQNISNTLCSLPDEINSPFSIKLTISKHFNIRHTNTKHIKTQSHDPGIRKVFLKMICKKLPTIKENIYNLDCIKIKHCLSKTPLREWKGRSQCRWYFHYLYPAKDPNSEYKEFLQIN